MSYKCINLHGCNHGYLKVRFQLGRLAARMNACLNLDSMENASFQAGSSIFIKTPAGSMLFEQGGLLLHEQN